MKLDVEINMGYCNGDNSGRMLVGEDGFFLPEIWEKRKKRILPELLLPMIMPARFICKQCRICISFN